MFQKQPAFFFTTIFVALSACSFAFADTQLITTKMAGNMIFGKTNADILFLQKNLNYFGYYKNDEDNPKYSGKFDQAVKDAVKDFQKTNEIKVTGLMDKTTVNLFNEFLSYDEESASEDEDVNQYVSTNTDESIDKYSGGLNYTTDFLDFYKSIPLVGTAIKTIQNIASPKKNTTTTKPVEQAKPTQSKSSYTVFDCLQDENCKYDPAK